MRVAAWRSGRHGRVSGRRVHVWDEHLDPASADHAWRGRRNVSRGEYERLKAILHNAAHNGPAAENRCGVPDFRAHLLGRIGRVQSVNGSRGAKLRERFDRIAWE